MVDMKTALTARERQKNPGRRKDPAGEKNPAAVELGKLGGLKHRDRSREQRRELARLGGLAGGRGRPRRPVPVPS